MIHPWRCRPIVLLTVGLGGVRLMAAAPTTLPASSPATSPGRVLHFPQDRSLGTLSIQDANLEREIETFFHHMDVVSEQWEQLGEARGDVVIPAGQRVALSVGREGWEDLSPLAKLAPDDLYQLTVSGSELTATERKAWGLPPNFQNAGDGVMPHVARLTGLKVLDLRATDVTTAGLQHIEAMHSLECLHTPRWVNDAGIAHVARLTGLKRVYFQHNRVTDKGLAVLCELKELEELDLPCERISEQGLVHLSRLPNLQYLSLSGAFGDAAMTHVSRIRSLKILLPCEIGDEGLSHLTDMPHLERLYLGGQRKITDAGMAHVVQMPALRRLDIIGTGVTDAGAARLRELRNLELLHLSDGLSRDVLVGLLASQPHLRDLRCEGSSRSVCGNEVLEQVGKMSELERLFVCGKQVTDAGMDSVGKCTKLKSLTLFHCPITDEGLAQIGRLKSLTQLEIFDAKLTTSGLKRLNGLDRLVHLRVGSISPDEGYLDISGLTSLRELALDIGIGGQPLRDADLACLANLKRLRQFGVETWGRDDGIGDAGLAHLAGLTGLQRLAVGDHVTDAGLAHLAGMKQLSSLTISGDLTAKGLLALEQNPALGLLEVISPHRLSDDSANNLASRLPRLGVFRYGPDRKHLRSIVSPQRMGR